ncbi:predicted protein [Uncinocarpus reesii 1704]|uniref:Uncharacterized protein n=1 Tax=Uncinocarpus reesii (strain UAMH 1704) TaxID=336963 RepID=C4JVU1_UNCRE|nr:uncharacterized protein UREG_06683 [Uncinocarpus reesii 1704]EEP81818.1 predicted protein [Uncinocarpus reesii 1704]
MSPGNNLSTLCEEQSSDVTVINAFDRGAFEEGSSRAPRFDIEQQQARDMGNLDLSLTKLKKAPFRVELELHDTFGPRGVVDCYISRFLLEISLTMALEMGALSTCAFQIWIAPFGFASARKPAGARVVADDHALP